MCSNGDLHFGHNDEIFVGELCFLNKTKNVTQYIIANVTNLQSVKRFSDGTIFALTTNGTLVKKASESVQTWITVMQLEDRFGFLRSDY